MIPGMLQGQTVSTPSAVTLGEAGQEDIANISCFTVTC